MGARENLQKLADKKALEIADLEHQLDMARSYLQAIQDSIKALPREASNLANSDEHPGELRPGTLVHRAKEAIQKNGEPMHVSALLVAIGVENTKKSRVSLVGSLGAYVRRGVVFTRSAPNTFGLVGMKSPIPASSEQTLPETFGRLTEED